MPRHLMVTQPNDIAQDYYNHGVGMSRISLTMIINLPTFPTDVTMFQRSSTYIISTTSGWKGLVDGRHS